MLLEEPDIDPDHREPKSEARTGGASPGDGDIACPAFHGSRSKALYKYVTDPRSKMVAEEVARERGTRTLLLAMVPAAIILGFLLIPAAARVVLGISLVLFIPGFTMVYALFNEHELDDIERVALSIGLSICIVVFDGLLLNYTPRGLTLDQIVISLASISGAFTAIGYYRRTR